jgi:hypothetical protein
MSITSEYLDTLQQIYKDVLSAFHEFDPTRQDGDGLAFQSLYSVLAEKYTLGEIRTACLELEKGGAVQIKHEIFAHPTELGEELIEAITGKKPVTLPPFVPPPRD